MASEASAKAVIEMAPRPAPLLSHGALAIRDWQWHAKAAKQDVYLTTLLKKKDTRGGGTCRARTDSPNQTYLGLGSVGRIVWAGIWSNLEPESAEII